MSDELTREEVHERIDRLVNDLLDSLSLVEPPVDAIHLAQHHFGMKVFHDRIPPGSKGVLLRPEDDALTQQATAAWAIGEAMKPEVLRALGFEPGEKRPLLGGSLTGMLADRLLVPTDWLTEQGRASGWDLLALHQQFATATMERIAWRLLDLDEPCILTVVDNGHVSRRRSNGWRVTKKLSPLEEWVQREVHRYSRPVERNEGGWYVQGWPAHRPDWKQEILRSVCDEDVERLDRE